MSLRWGYLTSKRRQVWSLKSEGYTEAGIGRKLNIKRQTVHKALNIANQKIHQSLEETAKINIFSSSTSSPTSSLQENMAESIPTEVFYATTVLVVFVVSLVAGIIFRKKRLGGGENDNE